MIFSLLSPITALFSSLPLWPLFILLLAALSLVLRGLDECLFMRMPPEGTEAYAFAQSDERERYLDYMQQLGAHHGHHHGEDPLRELDPHQQLQQPPLARAGGPQQAAPPPPPVSETDRKALLASFTSSKFYRNLPGMLD